MNVYVCMLSFCRLVPSSIGCVPLEMMRAREKSQQKPSYSKYILKMCSNGDFFLLFTSCCWCCCCCCCCRFYIVNTYIMDLCAWRCVCVYTLTFAVWIFDSLSWSHHVVFQSKRLSTFEVMAIHLFVTKTLNWDIWCVLLLLPLTPQLPTFFNVQLRFLVLPYGVWHLSSFSFNVLAISVVLEIFIVHIISIHIGSTTILPLVPPIRPFPHRIACDPVVRLAFSLNVSY